MLTPALPGKSGGFYFIYLAWYKDLAFAKYIVYILLFFGNFKDMTCGIL